ncbi:MAG: S1C family serine protease [Actinomycetia bacterium]|nr:S1C family serine protease [Actinomycetes bacterium]
MTSVNDQPTWEQSPYSPPEIWVYQPDTGRYQLADDQPADGWSHVATHYGAPRQPWPDPRYETPGQSSYAPNEVVYQSPYGPMRQSPQPAPPPPWGAPPWGAPPPTGWPPAAQWAVGEPLRPKARRGRWLAALVGAVAVVAAAGLTAAAMTDHTTQGAGTLQLPASAQLPNSGQDNSGQGNSGQNGSGQQGPGQQGQAQQQSLGTGQATAAQQVGVVDINTVLSYQYAQAAGTGMIITSSGDVLTNNHVVQGATSITVTVVATGKTYPATVVGTDRTDDVAVIHMTGASGLRTIATSSVPAAVGDPVTGVGNAGGVGGVPSAAEGHVLATGQTITASDESGANAETLHNLIETDAPIQAGDSGGPLYNNKDKAVGMDTAAAVNGYGRFGSTATGSGYAIPISDALTIAKQIQNGEASSKIRIGYPAFLGVQVTDDAAGRSGAQIVVAVPQQPAANAGMVGGDLITAIGGRQITSAASLGSVLDGYQPGARVAVTYTDSNDASHTVTVTLGQGPAD